ncbi:MAG: NADH-quinone oxidoreductase subunit N [Candidatus Binatus sp.]|uniref:NADH-quinone oxidoreductase subunit N n=1 Tax=Candidatus Binatus sp. TaxID=2811406 RepID=UPI0027223F35|nr:NADH-quinone oxidoreductase subunit N [Candidatus Binatus sp.]MDO8431685.1 NADH-quinone oxidoreductase subunit N [Candidatus Binatus sp.]
MTPFNVSAINIVWLPIIPMIVVAVAAMVVLLVGIRMNEDDSEGLGWLTLAALFAATVLTFGIVGQSGVAFAGAISIDSFAAYFELAILIAAMFTVLMSLDYAGEHHLPGAEYYSLLLFSVLGMMLMATAGDLIIIFLGLETMSLSVYVLAGIARRDPRSNEAAIKYFLLGAFSTGFLLYGIALVYGATGTIKLGPIHNALASGAMASNSMLLLGIGMMLIGFGFKVAAVPFHMWTPDVYEGAPTPVTAFMAVGVKLAAFAAFIRVFLVDLTPLTAQWSSVLWVITALTMTAGNLIAISQTNIKRMLAYSAIAHAGYLLLGMTAGASAGGAILYYLVAYAFTNLGAFAVVIALERTGAVGNRIADYRGLATAHPMLAAAMAVFLLSLTGVPPMAGFVGKFYLFYAALHQGYVGLVVIAVLNSVISAYYYFSVLVAMYMQEGGVEVSRMSARPALVAAIGLAAIATVLIGVYPQPYIAIASNAFHSASGAEGIHSASLEP